jgi:hypothetical protein
MTEEECRAEITRWWQAKLRRMCELRDLQRALEVACIILRWQAMN